MTKDEMTLVIYYALQGLNTTTQSNQISMCEMASQKVVGTYNSRLPARAKRSKKPQ